MQNSVLKPPLRCCVRLHAPRRPEVVFLRLGWMFLVASVLTTGTLSAQTAWTSFDAVPIQRLDLESGETGGSLGTLDISVWALAGTADGRLFAAGREDAATIGFGEGSAPQLNLYVIDISRRTIDPVGPLNGLEQVRDMTVDADGGLWLISSEGNLVSVDPQNASLEVIGGINLLSIAFWQGQMWGLQRSDANPWGLVTLDSATGETTLTGSLSFETLSHGGAAMDFDGQGNLWIRRVLIPGIPIDPSTGYFRLEGVDADTMEEVIVLELESRPGFAIDRTPAPTDIPVVGHGGRLVLVLLLAAAAGRAIRRP